MTTTLIPCPTTPAKLGRVATIGYHQLQAWQIMTRMVYEHGWYLVDICSDRRSYLDEWSAASLWGHFRYSYHAVPELGTLQAQHTDQPVQSVQLADPATGLEAGYNCLLLCACPDWQYCHRKQVAQLLQQVYPPLEVTRLVPDACVVDLPLWCGETVALLQRYGLLRPLPHTPQEQPGLLRTARSQGVLLPGYGQCTLSLSPYLWMPPHPAPTRTQAPALDEHERHPSPAALRERNARP